MQVELYADSVVFRVCNYYTEEWAELGGAPQGDVCAEESDTRAITLLSYAFFRFFAAITTARSATAAAQIGGRKKERIPGTLILQGSRGFFCVY